MTLIRIDPEEMESATSQLSVQADALGQVVVGLRSQAAGAGLPPAIAGQVDTTLAILERSVTELRIELLLEAVVLSLRGTLATKGSPLAGELVSAPIVAPAATFGGGLGSYDPIPMEPVSTRGAPTFGAGIAQPLSSGGYTGGPITEADILGMRRGGQPGGVGAAPSTGSSPGPLDNVRLAESLTADTDGDGKVNGRDANPFHYDREYASPKPYVKPSNF